MTSTEWAKLHPERFRLHKLKWRMKNRKPCRSCSAPMPYPSMGRKYCTLCQPQVRIKQAKKRRNRAMKAFHKYKETRGCTKCGYRQFGGALDFDHIDPSTKTRRILAIDWFGRTRRPIILAELKKCQLLCANCHREKTFKEDNNG